MGRPRLHRTRHPSCSEGSANWHQVAANEAKLAARDINPAKLRDVVETYSDPRYRLGLADVQPDFLGRAYEYLLRKFAEGSGQSAGYLRNLGLGDDIAWCARESVIEVVPRFERMLGRAAEVVRA